MNGSTVSLKWVLRIVGALARRPDLLPTALIQALRLAPRGWWRTAPFLPVPASDYLRFRAVTAYGDPSREPDVDDVITWLSWSKVWPAVAAKGRHPRPDAKIAAK